MNSKGHFLLSLFKSAIRIIGAVYAVEENCFAILACSLVSAEILGVLEELVDYR